MRSKTKKQFQRAMLYLLVAVFIGGTLLLYLPLSSSTPQATPPPAINQIPGAQGGLDLQNQQQLPAGAAQGGTGQQNPATQQQPVPAGNNPLNQ